MIRVSMVVGATSMGVFSMDVLPNEEITTNSVSKKGEGYMNIDTIRECTEGSFNGTLTFPEVVRKLAEIGIESYVVDLISLKKTVYGKSEGYFEEEFSSSFDTIPVVSAFNAEQVQDALRNIQQQRIGYVDFLKRIMEAGVCRYEVFIEGRKVIYLSRSGDFHIEPFPSKIS